MVEINQLYPGDCLEVMQNIPDKSIDMILCDLPYGSTACKWDMVIPLEPLWKQYKRIIKDNSAIVLTGSQPFISVLIASNLDMFKYEWIWDKKIPSGMSYARFQPMRQHENILVFCQGSTIYNPQMSKRDKPITQGGNNYSPSAPIHNRMTKNKEHTKKVYHYKNPTTILSFDKIRRNSLHPTQKPVSLFEYLIKTYTNEGDLVLDNCAGSGTTAIACINTNRNYILIEKDEHYCEVIRNRIDEHLKKPVQLTLSSYD